METQDDKNQFLSSQLEFILFNSLLIETRDVFCFLKEIMMEQCKSLLDAMCSLWGWGLHNTVSEDITPSYLMGVGLPGNT